MNDISICFNSNALPSQVHCHPWLHISSPQRLANIKPHKFTAESPDVSSGKWLLYYSTDVDPKVNLSPLDKAWQSIKNVVSDPENAIILKAKCSTKWQDQYCKRRSHEGVICCFTADYKNKQCVIEAADLIRSVCPYPMNLFYKTKHATYLYEHGVDKIRSLYKYTAECKLYERDRETHEWSPVDV